MNCLVLGGAGFIGSNLCAFLQSQKFNVTGFDLPREVWPDFSGVRWLPGDLSDISTLAPFLADADVVVHLVSATLPQNSNENPLLDLQANVAATLGLLDVLCRLNRPPRLIFLSSGGTVYGIPQSLPLREDHPTNPLCAYGVGKLAIEKYLALYNHLHGLDYRILRLANPYGEKQPAGRRQGVIPVFLRHALSDEPLEIWGDGTVVRDYFHVEDLSRAIFAAIHYNGHQRIFNIGSGEGHSLNELIEKIGSLLGQSISCQFFPARPCDVPVNILDIHRACHELGWRPLIPLDEGLRRTLSWLRCQITSAPI
ncbi:MAG: NAD-dependent epimerase/dehydratase family protein [Desulfococcus multivorans]|jgi:UDP-glucose 4-epimerase|nr:NAD-dependent epimerase/dehydratase family protein [Desulfococcus multivorans]